MKKQILLPGILLIVASGYGQQISGTLKPVPYRDEQIKILVPEIQQLKGEGDVFYSETFDWEDPADPKGWALPAGWLIMDVNDFGHHWVWRAGTDSIKGRYTTQPGHIYSKTPEDGYFVLPMDEYNFADNISTMNEGLAWFQLPALDFSNRPGIILKLSQNFRTCCNSPNVVCLVSNDRGTRWYTYDLSYKTVPNRFCLIPYPEVNISEAAAGMPEVLIRFQWGPNSHYFWCLDDLELSEAYHNELRLETTWLNMTDLNMEDQDEGFYFMVPLSQLGTSHLGEYTFKGIVYNGGINDQEGCRLNVEISRNGIPVYDETSPEKDLWAFEVDTFKIATPFCPDEYGDYTIVVTARQDQIDDIPANNVFSDTFYITDSVYSMSDWDLELYTSPAKWMPGIDDGTYLGVRYDISKACEAASISCMIAQRENSPLSGTQPGNEMIYCLLRWDEVGSDWIEVITSEYQTVTEEMINSWVTLPLVKDGESEFIEPGYYIAAIRSYHGTAVAGDGRFIPITIGVDINHPFSTGKSVIKKPGWTEWGSTMDAYMVRLNLRENGAPASADVVFNVDMTLPIANGNFNPGSDFVDVSGTFNNWGSSGQMDDPDGDGIYTLTVSGLPTFREIEYKYRINGNWQTAEYPTESQGRVHRVTFYNVLKDTYNNGISLGMSPGLLSQHIRIFPNPSDGMSILTIENPVATELNISVLDIQGSTVWQKKVGPVMSFQETINLTNCAKGLYFLKVNDQVFKLMKN